MPIGPKQHDPKEMPFLDHLEELRWCLIKSLAAMVAAAVGAYFFSDSIFELLSHPLYVAAPGLKFHFFKVAEAFNARLKLSLVSGVVIASPVIFYQLWRFVLPGLYEREVKIILPLVLFSTFFFLVGVAFCHGIMLPYAIRFLLGQAPPDTEPTLMIGDYLGFILWTNLAFGAVFQLPVVSFYLGRVGIVRAETLAKGRRYAIVLIAIAAAVLTPQPDVISQAMLGIPLYFLYEASIFIVRLTGRRQKKGRQLAG